MAGIFDFLNKPSQDDKQHEDKQPDAVNSSSIYKCSGCGTPLAGQPCLYCDGCGQYYCYSCGVASGDMVWNCPNCAIQTQRVNL